MPKIIDNLKEQILQSGKALLIAEGYRALTIRQVAASCNIAVGTVYNYYASKDALVAGIMAVDWQFCMQRTTLALQTAGKCMQGLECMFDAIRGFCLLYVGVWNEYGTTGSIPPRYHNILIGQLRTLIQPLLLRFQADMSPDPSEFLAETLLRAAIDIDTPFTRISPFIERIIIGGNSNVQL